MWGRETIVGMYFMRKKLFQIRKTKESTVTLYFQKKV